MIVFLTPRSESTASTNRPYSYYAKVGRHMHVSCGEALGPHPECSACRREGLAEPPSGDSKDSESE